MTTTADPAQRVADALAAVQNGPGGEAPAPAAPVPVDSDTLAAMSLAERLARITAEVGPVAKSGRNAHFGYSYQRAEDVGAAIAPLLGRYAVAITPNIEWSKVEVADTGRTTKGGSPIRDYAVPMVFHIACPMSDMDVPWVGLAIDDSDKGVNKAITAAVKSFLRAQFLIPTGDDDTDSTTGSSAAAEGGASDAQGTGELPDVDPGAGVSGWVKAGDSGLVGIFFRSDDNGAFNAIKDSVKGIPGRKWDGDAKVWTVPAEQAGTAVAFGRHLGLTIDDALAERFPVETAATDDLAPKADPPFAGPPNADDVPPGSAGGGGGSDDYDIPFAPSRV